MAEVSDATKVRDLTIGLQNAKEEIIRLRADVAVMRDALIKILNTESVTDPSGGDKHGFYDPIFWAKAALDKVGK